VVAFILTPDGNEACLLALVLQNHVLGGNYTVLVFAGRGTRHRCSLVYRCLHPVPPVVSHVFERDRFRRDVAVVKHLSFPPVVPHIPAPSTTS
jgi:hypothetical protein